VALTTQGSTYSWGENQNGELGTGDFDDRKYPASVQHISDYFVRELSVGANFTMASTIGKTFEEQLSSFRKQEQPLYAFRPPQKRELSRTPKREFERKSHKKLQSSITQRMNTINSSLHQSYRMDTCESAVTPLKASKAFNQIDRHESSCTPAKDHSDQRLFMKLTPS